MLMPESKYNVIMFISTDSSGPGLTNHYLLLDYDIFQKIINLTDRTGETLFPHYCRFFVLTDTEAAITQKPNCN